MTFPAARHKNGELLILIELDKLLTDEEWAELESA